MMYAKRTAPGPGVHAPMGPKGGKAEEPGGAINHYNRTPSVQPRTRHTPDDPIYSPLGIRRCGICGERGRWRRIAGYRVTTGGWVCCGGQPWTRDYLIGMAHVCGAACVHGRGAA